MPIPHLAPFGPVLGSWFERLFVAPTTAQQAAWPVVMRGDHLLLTAPTGQGKTLAAMLPIIANLLLKPLQGLACLYLAPLKALCNNFVCRLGQHLTQIHALDPGRPCLSVAAWTGDSNSYRRRKLRSKPPSIAVTTPESLALWLTHADGREALASLRWIVIDEVHSLAGTKRGADLSITLERVSQLATTCYAWQDSPQRIGLSATCSPISEVGKWLGGVGRKVEIVRIADQSPWELQIEHLTGEGSFVTQLMERLPSLLERSPSTLIFTNTRHLAERLTWLLRQRCPQWGEQIAIHHGSLAQECRAQVELGLQEGKLRAVVTCTSLELGVDIGGVNQVILVHPPGGVARLLQRLGRSGHTPTGTRRGIVFTSKMLELTEAVVTRAAGELNQLEPMSIPQHPLDVLSQQLLGMGIQNRFTPASAWQTVRQAYPFRDLPLGDFSECLAYVAGKRPRIAIPARLRRSEHFFLANDPVTVRVYRQNLGVIFPEPERQVSRSNGEGVGQVTDNFANQLQPGDRFLLQGRSWEVKRLGRGEIEVEGTTGLPVTTHWEGVAWHWPQALAERAWHLRSRIKDALLEGILAARRMLRDDYSLNSELAARIIAWCEEQETVSEIPDVDGLIEVCPVPDTDLSLLALHAPLGQAGLAGLATVLACRLRHLARVHTVVGTLGCGVMIPQNVIISSTVCSELLSEVNVLEQLASPRDVHYALAERFRATTHTGLMLLKNPLGPRRRVGGRNWAGDRLLRWLQIVDPDFPLLTQARREVAQEVFASQDLTVWLRQLREKPIHIRQLPGPSPFTMSWFSSKAKAEVAVAPPLEEILQRMAQER